MEENTQAVVNELRSHGGRTIIYQDIGKCVNEISELLLETFEELGEYE